MWKYVSRRFRESCDRAYNILDVRKNWSCGAQQATGQSSDNEDTGCGATGKSKTNITKCTGYWLVKCPRTSGSSKSGGQEGKYRKRVRDGEEQQETPLQDDLLGAITWSGAIICGWYASQLLCLHRRQYGWENKGTVSKIFNVPTRALHSNFQSYTAFASPVQPSLLTEKTLKENFFGSSSSDINNSGLNAHVYQVSNENANSSQETPKKQSVQDAVADLVTYLGETEFRMGVHGLSVGNYRSAVAHLKLATSHNHPGATFNLGLCYEQGLGVQKNLHRAMECYQIASSMGHSKAIYNLGVFYAQGLGGLQKDDAAARQCFVTAAKLGQSEARCALMLDSLSKDNAGADGTILHKSEIENVHNFSALTI